MPGDVAAERSTGAGALRDIRSAQERLDELQKGLVRDSPPPTTWSERIATLNFSRKASVEWQTRKWETQIKGEPDTSTWSGYFADKFVKVNPPMEWLLQKSGWVGTLGLSTLQAVISTAFPSVIAKQYIWATILTSLFPSLIGNKLFKDAPYPLGPLINTVQWEASNVIGYYAQEVTKHFGNSTTHRIDDFTTRELSAFMSERLGNFKREPTADEITDIFRNDVNDFLAQRGYLITFNSGPESEKEKGPDKLILHRR